MVTRDSHVWWFVIAAAVITGLPMHFDLLHKAIPVLPVWVDSLIELFAWGIGVAAGVMRMSPLPISPEGRANIVEKNAAKADTATVAATVAAVKAGEAVQATTEAAAAAEVAKVESKKAADIP